MTDLYGMSDIQVSNNLHYLAYCIRAVIERHKAANLDYSTFANWLDLVEGRTYAPGENEVWSDVKQPQQQKDIKD